MRVTNKNNNQKTNEGFRDVWQNFKDVARRSVGAPVGQNRGALYQFTGELVQNAINDLAAAINAGTVSKPGAVPAAPTPPAAAPTPPAAAPTPPAAAPTPPAAPQKIDPRAAAALKGRLKAGQGIGKQTSKGFSSYVQGSGERFMGADDKGAPVFKRIQRESKYEQLNAIFESIINEEGEEAGAAESASSYVLRWIKQYTAGMRKGDFSLDPQIKKLAVEVENTWKRDKGKAAFQKIAQTIWAKAKGGMSPGTAPTTPTGGRAPTTPTGGEGETDADLQALGREMGRRTGAETGPEASSKSAQILRIINTMVDRSDAADLEKIVTTALGKIKKMDPDQFRNMMRLFGSGSYDPLKPAAPSIPPGTSPTAESKRIVKRAIK